MAINDFDDLPKLMYAGKFLEPLQEGYDLESPYGAKVSNAKGGMPNIKRDTINNAQIVGVSYVLNDSFMVDWFDRFYRVFLLEGSIPMNCKLSLGESLPQNYAAIILNAPKYEGMRGYHSSVKFQIAAQKIITDYDFNESLGWLEQIYGGPGALRMVNMFEKFATVDSNVLDFGL